MGVGVGVGVGVSVVQEFTATETALDVTGAAPPLLSDCMAATFTWLAGEQDTTAAQVMAEDRVKTVAGLAPPRFHNKLGAGLLGAWLALPGT